LATLANFYELLNTKLRILNP